MSSTVTLLSKAKELGLFDAHWYQTTYKIQFKTETDAFNDYLRKSTFANIQPSPNFDGMSYLQHNYNVYVAGIPPLQHYIETMQHPASAYRPQDQKWIPSSALAMTDGDSATQKYAIVLHIFYEDFISRFHDALMGLPFEFDLFIAVNDPKLNFKCEVKFSTNPKIQNIEIRAVPNRGRNFGPLLVEFGRKLLGYDFFLHLHSKKSLYSGKEQLQWADYLIEYLIKDKQIISQTLNILQNNRDLGLYYPTSYWNLPPWVNHWLKNKGLGSYTLKTEYSIDQDREFFSYPVGGMFWARPDALKELLAREWRYEDFPEEPLPSDGTSLHVLERLLPFIASNNGYRQFFYDPASARFTTDETFIFKTYSDSTVSILKNYIASKEIISFDVFDTVVKRAQYEPDLAKYILADQAGLKVNGEEFVKMRNDTELSIRIDRKFVGDVSIYDIYDKLISQLDTEHSARDLADLEFYIDLEMLDGKPTMVELVNEAHRDGKTIYFITDTYYSSEQIELLIEKSGVTCPFELYVSSDLGLRKDNSTMWHMINNKLIASNQKQNFLHIGDNVCSDSQNPGDLGLSTYHILHPMDKWEALGLPHLRGEFNIGNIKYVNKWGPILAEVGSNPFIR